MARDKNDEYKDDIGEPEQGEILAFMKDMEKESKSMMQDLMEIDDKLASVQNRLELDRADRKELVKDIEAIRMRIGVLEREDKREINEEEVAKSLLAKLKRWVDQVV